MSLAQRLADLAVAHSKGLLDDDEYRLLRQEFFEVMAGDSGLPSEAHLVSIRTTPQSYHIRQRVSRFCETVTTQPPPSESRPKSPFGPSLISGLLQLARHRRSSSSSSDSLEGPSPQKPSRLIPKFLTSAARKRSTTTRSTSSPSDNVFPRSPKRARRDEPSDVDIFEDGGLHITRDLRRAIEETRAEGHRMSEAFKAVERRLRDRTGQFDTVSSSGARKRTFPRGAPSPLRAHSSLSDLLSRPSMEKPSSSARIFPASELKAPSTATKRHARSQLRFPSSLSLPSRDAPLPLSRNISHLPYEPEHIPEFSHHHDEEVELADADDGAKIVEIRKRRLEVEARYEARIEYLRARLKGAELHERLMRR